VEGQFPFIVQSFGFSSNVNFCGATLIGPSYVLTTAHCAVFYSASEIEIVGGSIKENITSGEAVEVESVHIHPDYDNNTYHNDIAIWKLKSHFSSEVNVRTIKLAQTFKPAGTSFKVAGFGQRQDGEFHYILDWTRIQKIKPRDCRRANTSFSTEFLDPAVQFCALNAPYGPCQGDGGGPLFIGSGSTATQHGIISGNFPRYLCGEVPSLYTKVVYYRDWIAATTKHSVCVEATNSNKNQRNLRSMCGQMRGTYEYLEGQSCCHKLNVYKLHYLEHSWSGVCDSTSPIVEFCSQIGARYSCEDDVSHCTPL
jgi:secreted trypsin-like serine protease